MGNSGDPLFSSKKTLRRLSFSLKRRLCQLSFFLKRKLRQLSLFLKKQLSELSLFFKQNLGRQLSLWSSLSDGAPEVKNSNPKGTSKVFASESPEEDAAAAEAPSRAGGVSHRLSKDDALKDAEYDGVSKHSEETLSYEATSKSSTSESPKGEAAVAPFPSRSAGICEKFAKGHQVKAGEYSGGFARSSQEGISRNPISIVITIVTYNVWQENVKTNERMKAIGELMQEKVPDIILFQEVTPAIYETFRQLEWWCDYECVEPPNTANKKHFCLLLSKFPLKAFNWEPFKYSMRMRNRLIVAEINTWRNHTLLVANSHLKKPDLPGDTHSAKRISEANDAIGVLNYSQNVVFGGDMNWDEELDGQYPLAEGWVDAWEQLRPMEEGWTYDTISNPMIPRKKALQKRLDRFVCKLKDFELVDVEIIGRDVIPGLVYRRNQTALYKDFHPVLCSDHFGLLLRVSIK